MSRDRELETLTAEAIKALDAKLAQPAAGSPQYPTGQADLKKCPYCAELIKAEAIKCKHCGSMVSEKKDFLDEMEKSFEPTGQKGYRKCLQCGHVGTMKTWLRYHSLPQLITIVLLFFYLIPGIIFIAWGWGKYKCPKCGALAKNIQA